jgi:hypothetical protein
MYVGRTAQASITWLEHRGQKMREQVVAEGDLLLSSFRGIAVHGTNAVA